MKSTSILNQFKEILIAEEGAIGDVECVTVTDGIQSWNGWRYNNTNKKASFIGCLGNPPKKQFTWEGVKWKVEKEKHKPKHLTKQCNTITIHPGAAIMRFTSFVLSGKT